MVVLYHTRVLLIMDFCPHLIRAGVLTVGQLLEDDSSFQLIAPTWRGVYPTALGGNTDPPPPLFYRSYL